MLTADINLDTITRIHRVWHKNVTRQRFGQYVCNLLDITDDEIFYTEDENRVWVLLVENGYIADE